MILFLLAWIFLGYISYILKEKYNPKDKSTLGFCMTFGLISFLWIGIDILIDIIDDWREKHGR